MSDSRNETLWGMKPRHQGGDMTLRGRFANIALALAVVLALIGFTLPAYAQDAQNVDLRVEVHNLLTDMTNVRDGESWVRWVDQWDSVVSTQYANADIDGLAYGQVVEVPQSPADWAYVDWEEVPYEVRPSVALAHACGLMTGRVYGDGSLAWDTDEDLKRYEAANIAARVVELIFEVVLNNASYSRPGCPIAMEAYHGDPEVFKDLVERQAVRHDEIVAELRAAIAALEARPDLSEAVRALIRQDLDIRVDFQTEMSQIVREINSRWDELKSEVGSLWIVLAEYDEALQTLRQEVFDLVWSLCADGACMGEQGPEGPRGLVGPQGPQGPAGRDADEVALWSEFERELDALRGDFVTRPEFEQDQARQDEAIGNLDARVTVIEETLGRISVDYCPVWLNFTGTAGVGEFDEQNPYRPGMHVSANVGVNALDATHGVQIISYDVGQGNRPNDRADWWKESAFYESLPVGTVISITVRDATGATCTQTHSLVGY
jgi:hypothetical protein